jgi:hypothetical protein
VVYYSKCLSRPRDNERLAWRANGGGCEKLVFSRQSRIVASLVGPAFKMLPLMPSAIEIEIVKGLTFFRHNIPAYTIASACRRRSSKTNFYLLAFCMQRNLINLAAGEQTNQRQQGSSLTQSVTFLKQLLHMKT